MFELEIDASFLATHALLMPDGVREPVHEHDWQVVICVAAPSLDAHGLVMDFHELQQIVREAIGPLEGGDLNQVEVLAKPNPSAERVAEHLHCAIAPRLPANVHLASVTVTEAPGCRAIFRGS